MKFPGSVLTVLCVSLLVSEARLTYAAVPGFIARHDYVQTGTFIAVGDVNGDGIPDIVGSGNPGLNVLLGTGKGSFVTGPHSPVGVEGLIPVLFDFNGDGILDVALGGEDGPGNNPPSGLAVSFGNGDGTFQTAAFYPIGVNASAGPLVIGDFNNDGIPDIALLANSGVWFFRGVSGGTFQAPVLVFPWASADELKGIVEADFNGDGKLDFAVGDPHGFTVLLGKGNGTFQPPMTTTTIAQQLSINVGDVDLDGKPDLILRAENLQSNDFSLYLGKGDGTFEPPTYPDLPGEGELAIGDVNNDGKPDLVTGDAYVVLGNGKGQFGPPAYYPTATLGEGSGQMILADLRNNGLLDMVEGNGIFLSVILNKGKGKYDDGDLIPTTPGPACGATANFIGGNPGLAVTTLNGISLFNTTGNAAAPFTGGPSITLSDTACPFAGDFNNDGIPDLMVGVNGAAGPTVNVYLGNGAGGFKLASTRAAGNGGYFALGDFNHDGNLDWASSANLLTLGNGDGTFQAPVPLIPSCAANNCPMVYIAAADLNHDGWTDIVLTLSSDSMYVLLNNQHGGFTQTTYTKGLGGSPYGIAIGDLNGDGNLDIFVAFDEIDGGAIYLGNGKGGFAYKDSLTMPVDVSGIPLIADVNGDGIPDILIACDSTTAVFLGKGNATYGTPFYLGTGPSPDGIFPMDLHGQAGGAGVPDLVFPDQTGFVDVLINVTR